MLIKIPNLEIGRLPRAQLERTPKGSLPMISSVANQIERVRIARKLLQRRVKKRIRVLIKR